MPTRFKLTSTTARRAALLWMLAAIVSPVLPTSTGRAEEPSVPRAGMVLRRGAIYTMDAARSWAESLAITDGRIVAVGPDREIAARIGPDTRQIALDGKMVLPGFHDAHVHPEAGIQDEDCQLAGCATEEQVRDTLRRFVHANPKNVWIKGRGWALPIFPAANPRKSLLDEIVPDRPVYLIAGDGHSAWVNSRALELAGIGKDTPDPPNGHIERDPNTGEATGTLRENAMELVWRRIPPATAAERVEGLRRGLARASRYGITTVHDADAYATTLESYAALERAGALNMRVTASLHADPGAGESQIETFRARRQTYRSGRLRADAVKIFVDGVIEAKTAAILEPYEDSGPDRGQPNWPPEALNRMVVALDREKFQVHMHAIGDRAVRMALDAFEKARAANGERDSRHHIAHLELIDPADLRRFRRLGVIANFQTYWAQADPYILRLTQPLLGSRRSRWLYPVASVADSGATVVLGSDWPVTTMNPLEIMQVAITRRDPAAGEGPAWLPEQRVTLSQCLTAYTITGAYLGFRERETGSIEVGKAADLAILDRNLFDVPSTEIFHSRVWMTLFEGKIVHEAKP